MKILTSLTWKTMWKNRTRTIVTLVGIVLSAAMFMAVMTLALSLWNYMVESAVRYTGDYFVYYTYASDDQLARLHEDRRITSVADYQTLGFVRLDEEEEEDQFNTFLLAACDARFFETMPVMLTQGRLPASSSEIVVSEAYADALAREDKSVQLGEKVTFQITTQSDLYGHSKPQDVPERTFSKEYTVVGVAQSDTFRYDELFLSSILTCADGNQGDAIWHRLFVKTFSPKDALSLPDGDYGVKMDENSDLLDLYGVTKYTNVNRVIVGFALALCAIIMLGSVSLIYNAFSISVSERTKQFGLLSSVGATKKQLRRSVFLEALILCALAIPAGIACGFGGIAVTLTLLEEQITKFIGGDIPLRVVISPLSIAPAALIGLLTVFLSAAIPARRALKITPMDAIRQTGDYRVDVRKVKPLRRSVFGMSGALARKYYRVSRKKYRATVISLSISIVLFVAAASFSSVLQENVEQSVNTENFDFSCYGTTGQLNQLRAQPSVADSVLIASTHYHSDASREALSKEFWESGLIMEMGTTFCSPRVYYLEDAVLRAYLQEQGIDPTPYFDANNPTALVCNCKWVHYAYNERTGQAERYVERFPAFADDTTSLTLFSQGISEEVEKKLAGEGRQYTICYEQTERGELLLQVIFLTETADGEFTVSENAYFLVKKVRGGDGMMQCFYPYDMETQTAQPEPAAQMASDAPTVRLGARIDTLPFGISGYAQSAHLPMLILPMSQKPEGVSTWLSLTVNDREALRTWLDERGMNYSDYLAGEESSRTMKLIVDVFCYGFLVLISLISAANVFNTISTNIALRRRDFGVLRSVGMRGREMRRMMNCECMIYGSRALLWGLPISILASYAIHSIGYALGAGAYRIPIRILAAATVFVLALVFVSMYYAAAKMRRDTPIEAIRMENI